MGTKICEAGNGFVRENTHGDFRVYKKAARNFDGIYDVSMNHIATFYANGYYRDEYLGKLYHDENLADYETRKQYAISYLKKD